MDILAKRSKKLRLLVVDDEPNIVECLKLIFALDGHQVVTANSANTALGIFESSRFDIVCTDYSMPGMRGDELAAAIKAIRPEQPVLMITGLAYTFSKPPAVDYIVSKPFLPNDLRQAFRELIRPVDPDAEPMESPSLSKSLHVAQPRR